VGGSRPRSRVGNGVRFVGILNGGHRLSRSSLGQARRDEVSPGQAALLTRVVPRVLAQDAFGDAVAYPNHLVLLLTFEVVVPSVVAAPTAVASRRGPPAFGRGVVMSNLMAPGALDQGRGGPCAYKLNAPAEHAYPLA
jgi:hypothetical protein